MDAAQKKHLAPIHVADARRDGLIEEHLADGSTGR
jgi:hypothetical protein